MKIPLTLRKGGRIREIASGAITNEKSKRKAHYRDPIEKARHSCLAPDSLGFLFGRNKGISYGRG